jgi:hypothetical protein
MKVILCTVFICLLLNVQIFFGQDVVINSNIVNESAGGNGGGADGRGPFSLPPSNNSIILPGSFYITGNYNLVGSINVVDSNQDVTNNIAIMRTTGRVGGNVRGGTSIGAGNVSNNFVQIYSGNVTHSVDGGNSSGSGNVTNNTVEIYNGKIDENVNGGNSSGSGNVTNNTVKIYNGSCANVYGGYSTGNGLVGNNRIEIYNGIFENIFGGRSLNGNAENNTLIFNDGIVNNDIYGGYSASNRMATGNILEINGGTISRNAIGGFSSLHIACNNTVIIRGGQFLQYVYGGVSRQGETINNVVEIEGYPIFSTSTLIYGGESAPGVDMVSGNTLNMKTKEVRVLGVRNFENYNFYNPTEKGTVMLEVGEEMDLGEKKVDVYLDESEGLDVGDTYVLIRSTSGISNFDRMSLASYQGIIARYDLYAFIRNNIELVVAIDDIIINPRTKVLTQSRAGNVGFVGEGIEEMIKVVEGEVGEKIKPFIVIDGGKSKYDVGVEVRGAKVLAGLRKEIGERMKLGGYVEYGDGVYDTGVGGVKARGIMNYIGCGLVGKIEWNNKVYMDIGTRIGRYGEDFNSEDMGIGEREGEKVSYESDGMYVGGMFGGGYKVGVSDKFSITVDARVMLTYEGNKEVELSTKDKIQFEEITNRKIKMGLRGEYEFKQVKPYVGMGYEHEMMGEVRAKARETEIPKSELSGGSEIGEVGVRWEIWKLNVECGGKCSIGTREGVEGMLKVRYAIVGKLKEKKEDQDKKVYRIKKRVSDYVRKRVNNRNFSIKKEKKEISKIRKQINDFIKIKIEDMIAKKKF